MPSAPCIRRSRAKDAGASAAALTDGRQHLRHAVPLHHLGRKPRAGDRLRRRRGAAAPRRSPKPTSSPGSTGAGPASRASRRSAARADQVKILSGVFEGETTGTPILLLIENEDPRSKDYRNIADRFRPGHADYTYWKKYGIRDYRGGGRASARETASRVAAGAVARKILGPDVDDPRRAGADRAAPRSTAPTGIGSDRRTIRSGARTGEAAHWAGLSRRRAQGRLVGRRGDRGRGERRAGRIRRADLRQARRRSRARDDDDQRGEGRRDRRRLRRRGAARRGKCRRDAHAGRQGRVSRPTMPAASSAASRPGRTSSCALR